MKVLHQNCNVPDDLQTDSGLRTAVRNIAILMQHFHGEGYVITSELTCNCGTRLIAHLDAPLVDASDRVGFAVGNPEDFHACPKCGKVHQFGFKVLRLFQETENGIIEVPLQPDNA